MYKYYYFEYNKNYYYLYSENEFNKYLRFRSALNIEKTISYIQQNECIYNYKFV